MKAKLKNIMIKGGFSVIIAVVAMSLYLMAMHFANKYFENITKPAEIVVNEKGEISIQGFETEKNEIIYVLWETDAGNIKPVKENQVFKEQNEKKNNKWYYVNTAIDEAVAWDSKDADGYEYTTATVKAVIYSYNKEEKNNQYYMGNYVNEMNITVTIKNNKIVKAEKERYFSNPIRKDDSDDWNQIYIIDEDENGNITYRFRTGSEIKEEILILCWEAEKEILSETDYKAGLYPECKISDDNANKKNIIAKNTITVKGNNNAECNISAYLISEDAYDAIDEKNINIEEKDKQYKAQTNLTQ